MTDLLRLEDLPLGESRPPLTLALSPDGARLALGGGTRYATPKYRKRTTDVVLIDLPGGALVARGQGHPNLITSSRSDPSAPRLTRLRREGSGRPARVA
jgi:hypothetical protein